MASSSTASANTALTEIVVKSTSAGQAHSEPVGSLIEQWLSQGMSPATVKATLLEDLKIGGRIFGPFLKGLRESAIQRVGGAMDAVQMARYDEKLEALKAAHKADLVRDAGQTIDDVIKRSADELFATGPEMLETWITVNLEQPTGIKYCPDCEARHGLTMTRAEWAQKGRPQWGTTICGPHCYCQLVPAAAAVKDGSLRPELERPVIIPKTAAQPPVVRTEKPR